MGRIFCRPGGGHLLNQHYLNSMFPLGIDKRVLEENEFMDMEVSFLSNGCEVGTEDGVFEKLVKNGNGNNKIITEDGHRHIEETVNERVSLSRAEEMLATKLANKKPRVKDFSRLWCYRNGGSPEN